MYLIPPTRDEYEHSRVQREASSEGWNSRPPFTLVKYARTRGRREPLTRFTIQAVQ